MIETINDYSILENLKQQSPLLIIYGGESCGICSVIKPQIELMIEHNFPKIKCVYVDCHTNQMICSQNSVFTIPVVEVYFEGVKVIEEIKSFSINQLKDKIFRLYSVWEENI